MSLLLNSKFPMFIAWGAELGFLYNDPYAEILGAKHPQAMGRRFKDIWSEIWGDIEPLISKALAGEATFHEDLPLVMRRKGYNEQTYFTFSYSPVRDETGGIGGMFCACTETTKEVESRKSLKAEKDRLQALFQQAPGIMAMVSGPEHIFELANASYLELVGNRELIGKTVREALPEIEGQGFFELLDRVYSTGEPFVGREVSISLQRRQGAPPETRYVDFVYQPITSDQGRVTGIFVEGHDVTERTMAMRHQHLLLNELNHRVKNTLATVQSITAQTLRTSALEVEVRNRIDSRLVALSDAHNLLTDHNWEGTTLNRVVEMALRPHRNDREERIEINGPEVHLSSKTALAIAMALHELATNAIKYGALSNDCGTVSLHWQVEQAEGEHRLHMVWSEQGGPSVMPPSRKGFGSRLIERGLAAELGGTVRLSYPPSGVVCVIDTPLPKISVREF
ncbi:sensor histidine kinase [Microvirga sp. GCM10011540]